MPDCLPLARYFPAIVCAEFDSPVDALRSLCVPQDEAMDLVAASWPFPRSGRRAIVTTIDGGRHVAALPLDDGRWVACYAYPEHAAASRAEAQRRLHKLTRGKKRGLLGEFDVFDTFTA